MIDVLLTIFWGVVLLSVIVVIHEGGHYLAARAFKVRVLEFMVGLPGPSVGFKPKKSETRFGVTAVPLGGYARIAGMDETIDQTNFATAVDYLYRHGKVEAAELEDLSEQLDFDMEECLSNLCEWGTVVKKKAVRGQHEQRGQRPQRGQYDYFAPEVRGFSLGEPRAIDKPQAFVNHERSETYIALPWWKRMIILFAGPGANLLSAIIVVTLVLSLVGTTVPSLTISNVAEGSPAATAGMVVGDTIVAVDGKPVNSWQDFVNAVDAKNAGDSVSITYNRAGGGTGQDGGATGGAETDGIEVGGIGAGGTGQTQTDTKVMQLAASTAEGQEGKAIIGVNAGREQHKLAPIDALGQSFAYIGQVTVAIIGLINPATTMQTISQSTSIIGVSVIAKEAASLGAVNFIWLAAVLSISIGLMNLLPLMPLDGGRMVVETIQRIRRKVASATFVNYYTTFGLVFVMAIFVICTYQDIGNVVSGAFLP